MGTAIFLPNKVLTTDQSLQEQSIKDQQTFFLPVTVLLPHFLPPTIFLWKPEQFIYKIPYKWGLWFACVYLCPQQTSETVANIDRITRWGFTLCGVSVQSPIQNGLSVNFTHWKRIHGILYRLQILSNLGRRLQNENVQFHYLYQLCEDGASGCVSVC